MNMAKKSAGPSYKHAPHVAWRRVENEAVVLDLNSSEYVSLNETAVLIWEKLGDGEPLERIQSAVCGEFDVSSDEALAGIKRFVKELTHKKLLLAV
jgi:hypothetical protein